jgi:hypothetical protein
VDDTLAVLAFGAGVNGWELQIPFRLTDGKLGLTAVGSVGEQLP